MRVCVIVDKWLHQRLKRGGSERDLVQVKKEREWLHQWVHQRLHQWLHQRLKRGGLVTFLYIYIVCVCVCVCRLIYVDDALQKLRILT